MAIVSGYRQGWHDFIATSDSFLYALNPDGSLRWKVPATRSQSSPALSGDGKIYLNSDWDFRLLCYDTKGVFQREFVLGGNGASGGVASFPTLRNGVVYVGSGNGSVYAFAASGQLERGFWPAFARDHLHTGRDIQCGIEALIDPVTGQHGLRCTVEPRAFLSNRKISRACGLEGLHEPYRYECRAIALQASRSGAILSAGHSMKTHARLVLPEA